MKTKEELEKIQRRIEAAQRAYTYSSQSDTSTVTRAGKTGRNPYQNLRKNVVSTGTGAARRAYGGTKEKEQADENTRRLLNGTAEKRQADENTTRLLAERRREKSAASKAYAKEITDKNTSRLLTGWEAGKQAARNTKNLREGRREASQADDNTERLLAKTGNINYYDDFLEVYNGKKDLSQYNEKQKKKIMRLTELMDEQKALMAERSLPMYQGRKTSGEIEARLSEIAKEAKGLADYERTAEDYGKNFMAGVEATGKGFGDFFANLWGKYSEDINTGVAKVARAIGGGESGLADTLERGIDEQRAARTETNEKWNRGIQERYGLTEAQAKTNEGVQSFAETMLGAGLGMLIGGAGAAGGIASGGASVLANNAGLIGMAASAAGRASAEAQAQGATRDQATLYGIGSGALEGLTEAIFDGIPGLSGVMSADALKKLVKNEAVQGVIGWAADTLGEGAEEVISAAIDPYLKRATYDPEAENATADELIEAFKGGAIQSAIMGMAHTAGGRIAGAMTKDGGYTGDIGWSETSPEMSEANRQAARNREDAKRLIEIVEDGGTGMDALMDEGARRAVLNRENAELLLDMSGGDAERAKELVRTAKRIERTRTVKEDKGAAVRQLTEIRRAQDAGSMAADEAEALRRIVLNTKVDVEIDEKLPAFMNGSVIGNKMTFNPNGKLDAQSLAIHEFTHIAENAKSYAKLKEAVKNGFLSEAAYTEAVEKKLLEYRTALEEAGRDAESFTKEDAEAEVVAERTQELLGLDERTIARMTQTKPSMVRRVIQAIDDMIRYFKGTEEERHLIEVRKRYVKAVTEGLKSAEKTKAAASIERDAKGRTYVKASRQVITGDTPSQWAKSVENYINEEIRSGRDVQFTATDGDVLTITSDTAGKAKFRNEITMPSGKKRLMTEEEYKAKLRAETHIDELAQVSRRGKKNVPDYKNHSFAKDGFNYRTAYFEDADGQYYEVTISVGQKGEIKTIYNVGKMIKQKEKLSLVAQRPGGKAASENFSNINISKDSSDVNNNMRKDREKDNKKAEKEQKPRGGAKEKFSLSKPVEETKELIAVHNTNADKLAEALELGGLPMPSIAVTKAKMGHEKYGDISIVFDKASIDPETDSANKVYGGDAWTPTSVTKEREIKGDIFAMRNAVKSVLEKGGADNALTGQAERFLSEIQGDDDTTKTQKDVREEAWNNTGMLAAYLADNGKSADVKRTFVEADLGFKKENAAKYEKLIKKIGDIAEARKLTIKEFDEKYGAALAEAFPAYDKIPKFRKGAFIGNRLRAAEVYAAYDETAAPKGTWEYSDNETKKAFQSEIDRADFDKWTDGLTEGLFGKEGIYNGRERFAKNGDRRSFSALHYEYNLENIVKAMKDGKPKGATGFGGSGMEGVATKDYKSIDEARADKGRLRMEDDGAYEEKRREYTDRLYALASEIAPKDAENPFIAMDNAIQVLTEAAENGKTLAGINRTLAKYKDAYQIKKDTGAKLMRLITDMMNMPTGYFEAKPERAVGLDEIRAAIMPKGKYAELKRALTERGVTVEEYDAEQADDRRRVLNEGAAAKERFSFDGANPKLSRKVFRDALMEEFHIGKGMKREAMEIIDRAAAEIVKNGKLSQKGAEELFTELMGRGVITERGDEYNRAVYDALHGAKLRITKNMVGDIERIYGSVKEFRKAALGKIALTNDPNAAAENIDTFYEGLQEDFGRGMFPDAMHPADMAAHILDAYERTAPKQKRLIDSVAEETESGEAFSETLNGFRETLHRALDRFGVSSAVELETAENYERQLASIREKRRDQAARAKAARAFREEQNRLLSIAKQLKKIKPGQAGYEDVPEIVREIDTVAKGISQNGRIRMEQLREKMGAYREEYGEDTIFSTHLMRQMDRFDNRQIDEMSPEEVRDLLDVCIEARYRIETQNRLIRETGAEELHEAAGRALSAIGRAKDTWRRNRNGGSGGKRSMARAKNVFLEISNYEDDNPLMQSFYDIEKGQEKMLDYQYRSEKAVMGVLEKLFPSKKAMEGFLEETAGRHAAWEDVDTGGQTLRLTAGMKMALYLHSKNRANMRHISGYVTEGEDGGLYERRGGGVVIPNERLYKKGNMKEAYLQGDTVHLTAGEVKRIAASLTAEQRGYADAMYDFLNGESKELINGVSRKLIGRDVAVVERYWPMTVATDKINSKTLDGMTRDLSVTSAGSLKERQEGSTAPLLLFDAPTAFDRNITATSKYVGYALPIENFRKLYNAGDGGTRVKEAIARKFGGSVATDKDSYIEEFIKDISKPADRTTFLDRQRGKAAAATMTLNPKVVAKQLSALFAAMDTLGAGNVMQALNPKRRVSMSLINKYTKLLWNRAKGYSSTAMEDVQNAANGKLRWLREATDYINKMDAALCRRMWIASELYTEKNRTDLTPGTDEFYMATAEIFNRAILDTQGGATMMQKSRNARSGGAITKGMNMFRSDAEAMLNMLGESVGRRNAAARAYKAALKNGSEQEKTQAREKLSAANRRVARTTASVIASNLGTAAIDTMFAALLGIGGWEKDEEGNIDVLKTLGNRFASSVSGIVLGGSELYSLLETVVSGKQWYDIELLNLSGFNDLANDVVRLSQDASGKNIKNTALDVAALFGIPARNVEKYLSAFVSAVSPEAGVAYENIWKAKTKSDLKYTSGAKLDATITRVIENNIGEADAKSAAEIKRLYRDGRDASVIPAEVGDRITINGLETPLMDTARETIQKRYAELAAAGLKDVTGSASYGEMSDEQRKKAIGSVLTKAMSEAKKEYIADLEGADDGEIYREYEQKQRKKKAAGIGEEAIRSATDTGETAEEKFEKRLSHIEQKGNVSRDEAMTVHAIAQDTEGEQDVWGGTVSGSKEKNAVAAISKELGVSHERAQEMYNRVEKYAYTTAELGKETRKRLDHIKGYAHGGKMTDKDVIDVSNAIIGVEATKNADGKVTRTKDENCIAAVQKAMGISRDAAEEKYYRVAKYKYTYDDLEEKGKKRADALIENGSFNRTNAVDVVCQVQNALSRVGETKDADGNVTATKAENVIQALMKEDMSESMARQLYRQVVSDKYDISECGADIERHIDGIRKRGISEDKVLWAVNRIGEQKLAEVNDYGYVSDTDRKERNLLLLMNQTRYNFVDMNDEEMDSVIASVAYQRWKNTPVYKKAREEAEELLGAIYYYKYDEKDLKGKQAEKVAAAKQYGYTEKDMFAAYNAAVFAEGVKDANGRTKSGSTKADTIRRIMKEGYTWVQANQLYSIMKGNDVKRTYGLIRQ